MIARATATRCFCPPLISYGNLSKIFSIPNCFAMGSNLFFISGYFFLLKTKGKKILSRLLKLSNKLKSWNTKPKCSLRKFAISFSEICVISLPCSKTCPLVGLSKAAKIFNKVVLPDPDSPMIATYSPLFTLKLTLVNACT